MPGAILTSTGVVAVAIAAAAVTAACTLVKLPRALATQMILAGPLTTPDAATLPGTVRLPEGSSVIVFVGAPAPSIAVTKRAPPVARTANSLLAAVLKSKADPSAKAKVPL